MKLQPLRIADSVALITGAAGGMGEHLAYGLSARGADVIVADRDEVGLDRVAAELRRRRPDRQVHSLVVDLSDRDATQAMIEVVATDHPGVNLLFNNAGVALAGRFDELGAEEFDWLLEINLLAPIRIVRGLLPTIAARAASGGNAQIVNTSSVFGLLGPYGQSAYATSKFGLRGFSESLTQELAPLGIGVTRVHPGGIRTNIAINARIAAGLDAAHTARQVAAFDKALRYPADRAAEKIIEAAIARRPRLLIGTDAKILSAGVRIAPTGFGRLLSGAGRRGADRIR